MGFIFSSARSKLVLVAMCCIRDYRGTKYFTLGERDDLWLLYESSDFGACPISVGRELFLRGLNVNSYISLAGIDSGTVLLGAVFSQNKHGRVKAHSVLLMPSETGATFLSSTDAAMLFFLTGIDLQIILSVFE